MRLAALFAFAALASGEQVSVTVLATTDLHGNLFPIDYVTDQPAARGLAKIATLARAAEAENPNHLLIDCGDTIQGTPLEYVYQTLFRTGAPPLGLKISTPLKTDPMILAMNRLGYDAMTVGNHEYNFGLKNLNAARDAAKFPFLSANTAGGQRPFTPYLVKTVGGVKVAIIGITTPAVPTWEKPENIEGYRFLPGVEATRRVLSELRAKERPDLVIVAAHSGLGPDEMRENVVEELASQVEGIDAIVFGHSHRELEGRTIGATLVVQPKNWGMSLARLDFTLDHQASGWKLSGKRSRLIPVRPETPAAADILEIAKPYHELAEAYLNTPVAVSSAEQTAALGRIQDNALVDSVQQAQLFYAKAEVSFTALFNPTVRVPKGQVTVRQIAGLYPYDNELYAIEGTGQMVKDALENAARYYLSCSNPECGRGPLINREVIGFNYDMAEGVEYEVDLTRPEGERIRNLRFHGAPLSPDRKLRIAINNYRAAGSAGYQMFKNGKIVWRSGEEIRDMMVLYYTERKQLPSSASGNWRIVPETARVTLEREAQAEAARPRAQ
jgi:2',3'-cyclic-nucleotide 2'-phosphodiesterase/3'-nucleotidase